MSFALCVDRTFWRPQDVHASGSHRHRRHPIASGARTGPAPGGAGNRNPAGSGCVQAGARKRPLRAWVK